SMRRPGGNALGFPAGRRPAGCWRWWRWYGGQACARRRADGIARAQPRLYAAPWRQRAGLSCWSAAGWLLALVAVVWRPGL
ncbi:hypothetical protein G7L34_26520, partial [Klebsiella quasipneumoniae]|nr:hypothetical protein [Klebsiella quasipneumoniae]